ncbi:hypothetical protein RO09_10645 [Streptococcus sobrinus]|nr:hypothetical protein RO09_10645 [Streptococcus sobrinus]
MRKIKLSFAKEQSHGQKTSSAPELVFYMATKLQGIRCLGTKFRIIYLSCFYQWFDLGSGLGKALQIALTVWETVKGWKWSLRSQCPTSLGDCQRLEMELA